MWEVVLQQYIAPVCEDVWMFITLSRKPTELIVMYLGTI